MPLNLGPTLGPSITAKIGEGGMTTDTYTRNFLLLWPTERARSPPRQAPLSISGRIDEARFEGTQCARAGAVGRDTRT